MLCLTLPAAAQTAAPAAPKPKEPTPEEVTAMIRSGDPAQYETAKARITSWFARGRVPKNFHNEWLQILISQKKYDEAYKLSMESIAANPDRMASAPTLQILSMMFLRMNKPAEAVSVAKSAYNVAEFRLNGEYANALARALRMLHPDDQTSQKFLAEQGDLQMAAPIPETAPEAPAAGSTIYSTIKINAADSALYEPMLAKWKARNDKFADRLNYGNMLLIADRGKEAEEFFLDLAKTTTDPVEKDLVNEALARSMRADGTLARGNVYMKQHPMAPPVPKTPKPAVPGGLPDTNMP
jgi:hypothetical protein